MKVLQWKIAKERKNTCEKIKNYTTETKYSKSEMTPKDAENNVLILRENAENESWRFRSINKVIVQVQR